MRRPRKKKALALMLGGGLLVGLFSFNLLGEGNFQVSRNLNLFTSLYRDLDAYYVDRLNPHTLITAGIRAMLRSLDPYTQYIPESEKASHLMTSTGEYGGIGAVIDKRQHAYTVLMPYEGYPAQLAGLKIGDQILKIDGRDLVEKPSDDIVDLIKGYPGTTLNLVIKRYGKKRPFKVRLVRERIVINNVPYHGMYDQLTGYIKLSSFTTHASTEVSTALNALKAQGAKQVILDLRNNPGGLLDEAIRVTSLFIPQGEVVVSTKGNFKSWNKTYTTTWPAQDVHIPLAILINGRTASAAEIVSGVMQDYDRGALLGSRTFGKGLVQTNLSLPYNSSLKITTARYYTPSGRCIQKINRANKSSSEKAEQRPDSLVVEFKTRKGRVVYDRGGITPDVVVKERKHSSVLYEFLNQGLLFGYATQYAFEHDTIASPKTFKLSDAAYEAFVSWANRQEVNISFRIEKAIEALETTAQKEGYHEGIAPSIQMLKNKLNTLKENYFQDFKGEVKLMLERDIISRYYLQQGLFEYELAHDPLINRAAEVLNHPTTYQKILHAQ